MMFHIVNHVVFRDSLKCIFNMVCYDRDPLDQLDPQEKKGTSASLDQWDLLEPVELAARSDLRHVDMRVISPLI